MDLNAKLSTSKNNTDSPGPIVVRMEEKMDDGGGGGEEGGGPDGNFDNFSFDNVCRFRNSMLKGAAPLMMDKGMDSHLDCPKKTQSDGVAIIGMACRLPGANDPDELWTLLLNKTDAIQKVPAGRWTEDQCGRFMHQGLNCEAGFLKCSVDEFDGNFFGMSPKELALVDPQHRLLLEVTWEALEESGINPMTLRGTNTSVFAGTGYNDYGELMMGLGLGFHENFFRSYLGNGIGASAGRISHFLGLTGPSIATESGCSSSMVAVGLAYKSLRRRESKIAIVGGVNLLLHPFSCTEITLPVAPDGRCKSFDAKADGFGRAEGCGVLVLKLVEQALRDGDRIHGIIRGYGESQEGLTPSIGTPTSESQAISMQLAMKDAGVDGSQVAYIETHGTGTQIGDPIEIEAITKAYSTDKHRTEPLLLGSVKSNIGHNESCSGITGIIKTLLSFRYEKIPPLRRLESLNPKIDLGAIPAQLVLESRPWTRSKGRRRLAGVSSLGITGTNAHIILEEGPIPNPNSKISPNLDYPPTQKPMILTLSAKSNSALHNLIVKYEEYILENQSLLQLSDISYTTNIGRAHFDQRQAVVGQDFLEILKQLELLRTKKGSKMVKERKPKDNKICFLFTGQGSEYFGMGRTLYTNCPTFRTAFDTCDAILLKSYGISIISTLWANEKMDHTSGQTLYCHIAIFCFEYAMCNLLISWGIHPDGVLGHSLGECAASTVAGIISLEDGIKLVVERSKLFDTLPLGEMVAVCANDEVTQRVVDKVINNSVLTAVDVEGIWLDIAAINSIKQTIVSGPVGGIVDSFIDQCKREGLGAVKIEGTTRAYHSRQMDPILSNYSEVARPIKFMEPKYDYISSVYGKSLSQLKVRMGPTYWVEHTRHRVKFLESSEAAEHSGYNVFIEVGPKPILSKLLKKNLEGQKVSIYPTSTGQPGNQEWVTLMSTLGNLYTNGVNIDWEEFHRYNNVKKVSLPTYPFQRKKYWFDWKSKGGGQNNKSQNISQLNKQEHTLLGSELINATNYTIFQNSIDLRQNSYIKDHAVGTNIIFPTAVFLEMSVAAGYQNPLSPLENPICISNLVIHNILALDCNESDLEFQTIISEPVNGSSELRIYSKESNLSELNQIGDTPWENRVSAVIEVCLSPTPTSISNPMGLDLSDILTRVVEEFDSDSYFEQFSQQGLNFGPLSRTHKRRWRNETEILAEVSLPQCFANYYCHPVVFQAMIQTLLVEGNPCPSDSLMLPMRIENCTWFAKGETRTNFIYVKQESGSDEAGADHDIDNEVVLFSHTGRVLCILRGVNFIQVPLSQLSTQLCKKSGGNPPTPIVSVKEDIWEESNLFMDSDVMRTPDNSQFVLFHWDINGSSILKLVESRLLEMGCNLRTAKFGEMFENQGSCCIVRLDKKGDIERFLDTFGSSAIKGVILLATGIGIEGTNIVQQAGYTQGILNLVQCLIANFGSVTTPPKIFVVTKGAVNLNQSGEPRQNPSQAILWGFFNCLRCEFPNVHFTCIDIDIDTGADTSKLPDEGTSISPLLNEIMKTDDYEFQVAFRAGSRYVKRHVHAQTKSDCGSACTQQLEAVIVPQSGRFELVLPTTNLIQDLVFVPMKNEAVGEEMLRVEVKSGGISFRDLLNILKPNCEFLTKPNPITDFAGVVVQIGSRIKKFKVGDPVCGLSSGNRSGIMTLLLSHVDVDLGKDGLILLPPNLTFAQGASLPSAFATAYHSLITIGGLTKGQHVLIHTASGSVGLCSVMISRLVGAEVIVTAGSGRKREFLRKMGIPANHILSSRSIKFSSEVMTLTAHKGVDLVLNTLSGEGFKESSLIVCGRKATFVELGKLNIWQPEEVNKIRPDVRYEIVDMDIIQGTQLNTYLELMAQLLKNGGIGPIPNTQFDIGDVKQALSYLKKAEHVGKVVCNFPNHFDSKSYLFNDRSTYMITGGGGGIGMEVAKWMLDNGAKYLVLVGRRVLSKELDIQIKDLRTRGNANVQYVQADIGNLAECLNIMKDHHLPSESWVKTRGDNLKWPPLRGIMHAAGVLSDDLFMNQTWPNFEKTFGPKVYGSWNLHEMTKGLNLEFFVMFSSIVSIFGNEGQTNYASANAFMDSLAHYRNSIGLPALSINWVQWSEVGVAKDIKYGPITPSSPKKSLEALSLLMRSHKVQAGVGNVNIQKWTRLFPNTLKYLERLHDQDPNQDTCKDRGFRKGNEIFENIYDKLNSLSDPEKSECLQEHLEAIIKNILELDPDDELSLNDDFRAMGLDSMMMMELRATLQQLVGSVANITVGSISDCPTVYSLTNRILQLIGCGQGRGGPMKRSFEEIQRELIHTDSLLPTDINTEESLPAKQLSQINTVFLTGATGNLGGHILHNLCQMEQIHKVYCLMRGVGLRETKSRLVQSIHNRDIELNQREKKKVEVILGNLPLHKFGLDLTTYNTLCIEVDAIVHCGVKANHLEEYRVSEPTTTNNNIRSVNVLGTIEVLRLASERRTKWVYHASSFAGSKSSGNDERYPEDWPDANEFDETSNFGYGISKFVADRLMSQGVERGIPCKVFRILHLGGSRKSGRVSIMDNNVFLRYLSYLKSGVMPSINLPLQLLPVDVCADASLKIFFNPEAPVGLYNMANPHNRFESEIKEMAEDMGYCVKVVDYSAFVNRIIADGEQSVLYPLREFYTNRDVFFRLVNELKWLPMWLNNPQYFFQSQKVLKFVPEFGQMVDDPITVLRRDIGYAVRSGHFLKLGIPNPNFN